MKVSKTMGIVCKRIDFRSEEAAIHEQASHGQRCSDCLRPFNLGERKYFKTGSDLVICHKCFVKESSGRITDIIPGKEAVQ